jgi:hypothetical protein
MAKLKAVFSHLLVILVTKSGVNRLICVTISYQQIVPTFPAGAVGPNSMFYLLLNIG